MNDSYYLIRGNSSFRAMKHEYVFCKYLFKKHNIVPVDLSRLNLLDQYSILKSAKVVLFVSGSAGLATINCSPECSIIEISPQSVFLSDVERHDSMSRGGSYTIYVCDTQSAECSETGDPRWVDVNYDRITNIIHNINDQSTTNS